jgi:hypothetical protein
MLKKSGKRKVESGGDMYRSIADRRVFLNSWEEFWGPAGCRLERRGERRRRGDWGRGLMCAPGGPGMDVQAELAEVVVEGKDRLDGAGRR